MGLARMVVDAALMAACPGYVLVKVAEGVVKADAAEKEGDSHEVAKQCASLVGTAMGGAIGSNIGSDSH